MANGYRGTCITVQIVQPHKLRRDRLRETIIYGVVCYSVLTCHLGWVSSRFVSCTWAHSPDLSTCTWADAVCTYVEDQSWDQERPEFGDAHNS